MKVQIGDRLFPRKRDAVKYLQEMLARYTDGQAVEPQDAVFLRELVLRHPSASEKVGAGIQHFTVEREGYWNKTRHFQIVRIDATTTDFSFMKCLNGDDIWTTVSGAMREAVLDQILEFKNGQFDQGPVTCPFTQEKLEPSTAHVDHAPPSTFDNLAQNWMESRGLTTVQIELSESTDNSVIRMMVNPNQRSSWQSYHRSHANLRLTSMTGNLSYSKLEKKKTPGERTNE